MTKLLSFAGHPVRYVTYNCPRHGEMQVAIIDWGGEPREASCPVCFDEAEEEARLKAKQAALERAWAKQGVLPEFFKATVANYKAISKGQIAAKQAATKLCKGEIKKVVLLGNNGAGKTHLAAACVKHLKGRLLTVFELGLMIRGTYGAGGKNELQVLDEFARLPFLVIDEMGRAKASEAMKDWLSYVLNKRHSSGLPFMLCGNAHFRADCKAGGCDGCFENLVGSDVLSRLQQDSKIVLLNDAEDMRCKH